MKTLLVLFAAALMCSTSYAVVDTNTAQRFTEDVEMTDDLAVGDDVTISGDLTVVGTLAAPMAITKSYSAADDASNGTFYTGGFYDAAAAESVLVHGGTVAVTHGTAHGAYGAHAFVVVKETATGAGGTVSLVVSGVSITDAGVRNATDTETIIADISTTSANAYYETDKKWLGTITFTLTNPAASDTITFNYGYAKYEDFGNMDFVVKGFECTGVGGATDTGFDITLFHHSATGWTFHASAFEPGGTQIVNMVTDYDAADTDLASGQAFSYKRTPLTTAVNGSGSEGTIIAYTTTSNSAVRSMTCHVGVLR